MISKIQTVKVFSCLSLNYFLGLFLNLFMLSVLFLVSSFVVANQTYEHWDSDIVIDESLFIPNGQKLVIDGGSKIKVNKDVELIFQGVLEVVGDGYVVFESAVEGERWNGLHFRNADEQVLKRLKVVEAFSGIKLENSGEVEIAESEFIDNSVAIEVFSSDGIRHRQNKITNSVISNNGTGISAHSTGVIVDGNHIVDTLGTAINLSGGTCGAGSRCGWASEIKNNLIENSTRAVNVFGHNIKILKNDIYNVNTGITFNLLRIFSTGHEDIKENNIGGWRHTALQNLDADNLDLGVNWIQDSEKQYATCDTRENISYGMINYVLAENPFSKSHEYQLPIVEDTNSDELGTCILDSYNYIDSDQYWEPSTDLSSSQFISSGATIFVDAGSTIKVLPDVELIFQGVLEVVGDGYVVFESAVEGERWNGLHFRNADEQVLKRLKVVEAFSGIKLENSGEVEIAESEFIDNSVAIEVFSSDGIRHRQNKITNSVISNNGTGISAHSTGIIAQGNMILNNSNYGINLFGSSCGGGGACGFFSEIYDNQFFGNNVSLYNSAHGMQIERNDFSCNSYSLYLNLHMNNSFEANNNNFGIATPLHIINETGISLNLGTAWFYSNEIALSSIFDAYDDPIKGPVDFSLNPTPYSENGSADYDNDGYVLLDEYIFQSCPNLADSDGDGIIDFNDIFPLDARYKYDSDLDGLPDSWESLYGYNPNNIDGLEAFDRFISGLPAGLLDIDGDGRYDALTDGLVVMRSMFGLRGNSMTSGVISNGAVNIESSDVEDQIERLNIGKILDIDGHGEADALTDGLITLRYLFGIRGMSLTANALSNEAKRNMPEKVEKYMKSLTQ